MVNRHAANLWLNEPSARLRVTAVPAFADNYIWLIHSPILTELVVAVDPGDAGPVQKSLRNAGLKLGAILITHHHADHVGGVEELVRQHNVPVFGPIGEFSPGNPERVGDGQVVRLHELGLEFTVLEIPGHTKGHIAYVGHDALFCGDTLFSAGCGRLFEGTAQQMSNSLGKLGILPGNTQVYCGHEYTLSNLSFASVVEPDNRDIQEHIKLAGSLRERGSPTLPSCIELESKINPFLRLGTETVKRAAAQYAGHMLSSESEIFAALRDWKDHFRPSPSNAGTVPA